MSCERAGVSKTHSKTIVKLPLVPGTCCHAGAILVKADVVGIGSETGENAIWVSVRESVDLYCVVGHSSDQFPILYKKDIHLNIYFSDISESSKLILLPFNTNNTVSEFSTV